MVLASCIARFRGLPISCLFIRSRDLRHRLCILWAHGATLNQAKPKTKNGKYEKKSLMRTGHFQNSYRGHYRFPPAAGCICATLTGSPLVSESGGLMTTDSSPFRPARTSISVPKSRPGEIEIKSIVLSDFTVATCMPADLKMMVFTGSVNVVVAECSLRWTST